MGRLRLPRSIILMNEPSVRGGHNRGLLVTRDVLYDLWEAQITAMDTGTSPPVTVECPEIRNPDRISDDGPEPLSGWSRILNARRAAKPGPADAREMIWTRTGAASWRLETRGRRDERQVYWIWDIEAASFVVGPLADLRLQLELRRRHSLLAGFHLHPLGFPAAFTDVLDDPGRWVEVLEKEDVVQLLESSNPKVREAAIRALPGLHTTTHVRRAR